MLWVAFLFLLLFVMQFLAGHRGAARLGGDAAGTSSGWSSTSRPHFLVMALPVAFLLAILLGLGRLGEDRELLALQSLGAIAPADCSRSRSRWAACSACSIVLLASTAEPWGLTAGEGPGDRGHQEERASAT